jgi:phage terminase small subunit
MMTGRNEIFIGLRVPSHSQIISPFQNEFKMAGKPGMKGGGGARVGAGRPKAEKPEFIPPPPGDTPLDFLKGVMNDISQEPKLRVQAAIAAAQYEHLKMGEGGKKDQKGEAAKRAGSGKYAAAAPPKLVVNNGK